MANDVRAAIVIVVVALLSACAAPVSRVPSLGVGPPADFPERDYREAAAQGRPVFRIDPASSLVVIEVRRAGALARLGHDHVVASHDMRGYVLLDAGRADLYARLDRLVVDEPVLRAEAHFDTQPSRSDIAGTRRNMLGSVLDAAHYPFARIRVARVDRAGSRATANVSMTLHGETRNLQVPLQTETTADDITISGSLILHQTDFGIVPLSILGGAIQVEDAIDLRFRLHATRLK